MSTYISQDTAKVGLRFKKGDSFEFTLDFDFPLTDYNLTAVIQSGTTTINLVVTITDIPNGKCTCFLSSEQSALILIESNTWYLKLTKGTYTRTFFEGPCMVSQ